MTNTKQAQELKGRFELAGSIIYYPDFELNTLNIAETAYELYKHDWVDSHTTRETRLKSRRAYYIYKKECIENEELVEDYEDWLWDANGFGGSLYACFDEFCESEYLDEEYMKMLLGKDLMDMYYDDLN